MTYDDAIVWQPAHEYPSYLGPVHPIEHGCPRCEDTDFEPPCWDGLECVGVISEDYFGNPLGEAPETCITDDQRELHVASEAVAVFAVTPFMFWLAAQKSLPDWARGASLVIGAGTLAVDGYLLWQYARSGKTAGP